MDISVVVPLYNEEESLPELFAWIERVMNANGFSYEVIFVNDGSTDRSWHVALGKRVYHRFARVYHISVVYEPEVDVVCHGGKQRGKHIHENGEYPCMQEADAASAYLITIHPCIIISHKRYA